MGKPRLDRLVVLVPGIGGSSLVDPSGAPLWGHSLSRFAVSVLLPTALTLDETPVATGVGLLGVARSMPGLAALHPYDGLVRRICRDFAGVVYDDGNPETRNPAANLVAFPYDFRRSIAEAAEALHADVSSRVEALGSGTKVVVIAHSMGGLVARWWLGPLGGRHHCGALITLGTPHRGAPKALDWLVNGVRVRGVPHPSATEVIRTWPSVYELLPRYRQATNTGRYPHELALPALGGKPARAFRMHEDLAAVWDDAEPGQNGWPALYAFFGHGHGTSLGVDVDGQGLTASNDAERWPDGHWLGDATVPKVSAVPLELGDPDRHGQWYRPVANRHGPLASAHEAVAQLKVICGVNTMAVRGGDQVAAPTVGVDLEDTVPADQPTSVVAWMHGEGASVTGGEVSWWPHGRPGQQLSTSLGPIEHRWSAELPPLPAGVYDVRVELHRDENKPAPMEDVITVVDEATS